MRWQRTCPRRPPRRVIPVTVAVRTAARTAARRIATTAVTTMTTVSVMQQVAVATAAATPVTSATTPATVQVTTVAMTVMTNRRTSPPHQHVQRHPNAPLVHHTQHPHGNGHQPPGSPLQPPHHNAARSSPTWKNRRLQTTHRLVLTHSHTGHGKQPVHHALGRLPHPPHLLPVPQVPHHRWLQSRVDRADDVAAADAEVAVDNRGHRMAMEMRRMVVQRRTPPLVLLQQWRRRPLRVGRRPPQGHPVHQHCKPRYGRPKVAAKRPSCPFQRQHPPGPWHRVRQMDWMNPTLNHSRVCKALRVLATSSCFVVLSCRNRTPRPHRHGSGVPSPTPAQHCESSPWNSHQRVRWSQCPKAMVAGLRKVNLSLGRRRMRRQGRRREMRKDMEGAIWSMERPMGMGARDGHWWWSWIPCSSVDWRQLCQSRTVNIK
eukprot:m.202214 g.202214  ORF g.202214 m.202214 type:complete len:431 (+) comp21697_c0_seq1:402-1694(+)